MRCLSAWSGTWETVSNNEVKGFSQGSNPAETTGISCLFCVLCLHPRQMKHNQFEAVVLLVLVPCEDKCCRLWRHETLWKFPSFSSRKCEKVYFDSRVSNRYEHKILSKIWRLFLTLCRCYTNLSRAWWNTLKMLSLILHGAATSTVAAAADRVWTAPLWRLRRAERAPPARLGGCDCWQRLNV